METNLEFCTLNIIFALSAASQGTGTSGPGCRYHSTTRCFALKGLRTKFLSLNPVWSICVITLFVFGVSSFSESPGWTERSNFIQVRTSFRLLNRLHPLCSREWHIDWLTLLRQSSDSNDTGADIAEQFMRASINCRWTQTAQWVLNANEPVMNDQYSSPEQKVLGSNSIWECFSVVLNIQRYSTRYVMRYLRFRTVWPRPVHGPACCTYKSVRKWRVSWFTSAVLARTQRKESAFEGSVSCWQWLEEVSMSCRSCAMAKVT